MKSKIFRSLSSAGVALTLAISLVGCGGTSIENNNVYEAKESQPPKKNPPLSITIKTQGRDPFFEYKNMLSTDNAENRILTVSPDKTKIYFQDSLAYIESFKIKGENLSTVELMEYDVAKKSSTLIGTSFVKSLKWSPTGLKMAYLTDKNRLYVYDLKTQKTEQEPLNRETTSFEWSVDGTKIYFGEGSNLNFAVFYPDSKTTRFSYETNEDMYTTAYLDNTYRFVITQGDVPEEYKNDKEMILKYGAQKLSIVDQGNNLLKEMKFGKIKDVYKRSMLFTETEGFGLSYYQDIEQSEPMVMTKEYVYDVKFVFGGNFYFITQDHDTASNMFQLTYVDATGNVISKEKILSSLIYVAPDGKTGIGNIASTRITFGEGVSGLVIQKLQVESVYTEEDEKVFTTIRGAVDQYFTMYNKAAAGIQMDFSKYFTNSENVEQSALYEVNNKLEIMKRSNEERMNDPKTKRYLENIKQEYTLEIILNQRKPGAAAFDIPYINYYKTGNNQRASANINVASRGYMVGVPSGGINLELIKQNEQWYVTGICTYPQTTIAKNVRVRAEQLVKTFQENGEFGGILKGKSVKVAQIQFWQLSEPHLAQDVETANYAVVFLKVSENGLDKIYKMVLNREAKEWKTRSIKENTTYGM